MRTTFAFALAAGALVAGTPAPASAGSVADLLYCKPEAVCRVVCQVAAIAGSRICSIIDLGGPGPVVEIRPV